MRGTEVESSAFCNYLEIEIIDQRVLKFLHNDLF